MRFGLTFQNYNLISTDAYTALAKRYEQHTWHDLIRYTHQLSYGRNSDRQNPRLVLLDSNNIPDVQLILCLYKMKAENTPGIGSILNQNGLPFIPEAHCYLTIDGMRVDITKTSSQIERIIPDIIEEREITPDQVSNYKVQYHKAYIKQWIQTINTSYSFTDIWNLREQCIRNLSTLI